MSQSENEGRPERIGARPAPPVCQDHRHRPSMARLEAMDEADDGYRYKRANHEALRKVGMDPGCWYPAVGAFREASRAGGNRRLDSRRRPREALWWCTILG